MFYRSIILAGAIALAVAAPRAQAQERWQGAYAGAGLSAHNTRAEVRGSAVHSYEKDSGSLALFGGYNFTRPSGFTWGPDVMLSFLSTPGQRTDVPLGTSEFKGSFILSPRVRLGYATDRAFFYGVVGLGLSDASVRSTAASGTDITLGGALGLGVEVAVNQTWAVRVETVGYGLDAENRIFNGVSRDTKNSVSQFTIGISRKF